MPADIGPEPLLVDAAADFLVRKFLLNDEQRKRLAIMDAKKKAAKERRAKIRKARVVAEEKRLSKIDRYVFGVTGEDVVRNQDRRYKQARQEAYQRFREEYQDEIAAQMTYIAKRFRWYTYSDDVDTAIRRKAERELWNEVKDEFQPEYDFRTRTIGWLNEGEDDV